MTKRRIYLDYNATAPVRPEVAQAVEAALLCAGNPSSVHWAGREAREIIEKARAPVAEAAGAPVDYVIFTSGGTEANNLALKGAIGAGLAETLVVSAVEHPSVMVHAETQAGSILAPVTADGVVDLAGLDEYLARLDGRALVSVMLANNETGVLEPVPEIVEIARGHGALVHTDAVQALGKIPVDFRALGVDMMTVSAHKIGGPKGVGALIVDPALGLDPLIEGGGQERRQRCGTENLPGIAGFGAAARLVARALEDAPRLARLRDGLERALLAEAPDARIFSRAAPRLPNTSAIGMPGMSSETQVMAFDLDGIAVSAGSACSSGKVEPSPMLKAMGAGDEEAASTIRVSLGPGTEQADIDALIAAWLALRHRAHARSTAA